ncbi:MAG: hypothetical protein PHI71_05020 [Acidiphilium sp.]|jgi:hypothetical protein|uniref:Uncharacterized protein n=1 Tax=Acidiphilium acidophilum TaxID=76588 RepID=A0AAW9DX93_ACIAO|nr:hypothetical protein [Acidiphilium acidophilum]MDD2860422.1 hypothetical protein [Acidiphilium sp.]MDX5932705.1 hypothetical protein [Acidiphilium acidophilum]MEE3500187.1 hypothetical protein [Acidiphilium acidophilum]
MTIKFVVVKPFGGFKRGDVITDATTMATILAEGHAQSVVRVMAGE